MSEPTFHPSIHFSPRGNHRVAYIIVHTTQTPTGGTPVGTLRYLEKNERQVSCHELVVPGEVYQMVPDSLAAHHAGYATLPDGTTGLAANQKSWGIELFNFGQRRPQESIVVMGLERVAEACKRFGLKAERVLGHREVDPTRRTDPDGIDMEWFRSEVAKRLGAGAPSPADDPLARRLHESANKVRVIEANFTAALLMRILEDGFIPTSNEYTMRDDDNNSYIAQRAESRHGVRVYYCPVGQWDQVAWK